MANTAQTPAPTVVVIKRHHFRWGVVVLVLLIGALVVGTFYAAGGGFAIENGKAVLTTGNLATLTGRFQVVTLPDGSKKTVIVQDEPDANGETQKTVDGFDPDHKLQRTNTDVDRFDPIDRLATTVGKAIKDTNANISETNDSVKALTGQVKDLGGKIDGVVGDVSALGNRVSKLETQPVAPAPAPTASPAPKSGPQAQADIQPAPQQTADVETDLRIPKGFKLTSEGDEANQAKGRACLPPHILRPDMSTGVPLGYNDPKTGKPVKRYKNMCV